MRRLQPLSLLLIVSFSSLSSLVWADSATLTWNKNTEADLAGYRLYQSTTSGQYGAPVQTIDKAAAQTSVLLPSSTSDRTYYFVLTSIDLSQNESKYSAEVSKLIIASVDPVYKTVTDALGQTFALIGTASPYSVRVPDGTIDPWGPWGSDLVLNNGVATIYWKADNSWWVWGGSDYHWTKVAAPTIEPPPPPPPPAPEIFSAVTNSNGVLSFQYDPMVCPKGVSKTTSPLNKLTGKKTVTMTCLK